MPVNSAPWKADGGWSPATKPGSGWRAPGADGLAGLLTVGRMHALLSAQLGRKIGNVLPVLPVGRSLPADRVELSPGARAQLAPRPPSGGESLVTPSDTPAPASPAAAEAYRELGRTAHSARVWREVEPATLGRASREGRSATFTAPLGEPSPSPAPTSEVAPADPAASIDGGAAVPPPSGQVEPTVEDLAPEGGGDSAGDGGGGAPAADGAAGGTASGETGSTGSGGATSGEGTTGSDPDGSGGSSTSGSSSAGSLSSGSSTGGSSSSGGLFGLLFGR
ncbi:MAG: hypothetical protein KatS3mg117_1083 [Geminicoccaceae bacterium]|nr:MAG: hypothetical protein KatS3mg117_1083 [Geminicoccaceae bacterium]